MIDAGDTDAIVNEAPWLCNAMTYELQFTTGPSYILGPGTKYSTTFYPFQRGFFTVLESEADTMIVDDLRVKLEAAQGLPAAKMDVDDAKAIPVGSNVIDTEPARTITLDVRSSCPVPTTDDVVSTSDGTGGEAHQRFHTTPRAQQQLLGNSAEAASRGSSLMSHVHQASNVSQHQLVPLQLSSNQMHNPHLPPQRQQTPSPVPQSRNPGLFSKHDKSWRSVVNGVDQIELNGNILKQPHLATMDEHQNIINVPPKNVGMDENGNGIVKDRPNASERSPRSIPNTPPHYVVRGDFKLWGNMDAKLSVFQDSTMLGIHERVELLEDLSLGSLITELKGTPPDAIALTKTALTYKSFFERAKAPGVRFETDVILTGVLQPVSDALKGVFGMEHPSLTVSGLVSLNRDWSVPMVPNGFTLRAELHKLEIKLGDIIEITDMGIDLITNRVVENAEGGANMGYDFSIGFFGGAGVKVPGSTVPLRVSWYMMKAGNDYSLSMEIEDDAWTNVLGVRGLNVSFGPMWQINIQYC
jgi:hypothetical protein